MNAVLNNKQVSERSPTATSDDLRACAAAFSPRDAVARWARGLKLAHAFAAGILGAWAAPLASSVTLPLVEMRAASTPRERAPSPGELRLARKELRIESDLPTFKALAGWERELLLPFVSRLVDGDLDDVAKKEG